MNDSMNMNRKQKTSYNGDSLDKIELDTRNKQGVFSDSSASSEKKTKSEINTEYLLESIVSKRNLFEAYKRVKKNNGSHGVDGMRVDELLPYLKSHATEITENLLAGTYKPEPVRRVEISKFDGGIELTSAGGLVTGMSSDEFYNGYSAPRNKELMGVFKDLKLVEQLDSGMIRILKNYDRSIFTITPNFIRVVFPFSKVMNNDSKELKESSFRESGDFEDVEIYGEISKSAGKCRNAY